MKKHITETVQKTITLCDVCGAEAKSFYHRVKPCQMCGKDVCANCAIITDHWCLSLGEFMGDYPDYYCEECWDKGKDMRTGILEARESEEKLWEEWKALCPTPQDK